VHPADHHLLAMNWEGNLYIDTYLPFGLRSAPKLFNILADFLYWILTQKGVSPVFHYLDDFLTLGPPGSSICANNLTTIKEVCFSLGIPLALEKVEGPSNILTFLDITLDTKNMMALSSIQTTKNLQPVSDLAEKKEHQEERYCPLWACCSILLK